MIPTRQEWIKLYDYAMISARNIMRKMPVDWDLTVDDIQGKVIDTILHLIKTYKPGEKSIVTYCYGLMEITTYRNLMQEYRRLKRNLQIIDDTEDDDDEVRHKVGIGNVKALVVRDFGYRLDVRDDVMSITSKVDGIGKGICNMVMYGMSQDEIARELGVSQQAIAKRLKKMRKLA